MSVFKPTYYFKNFEQIKSHYLKDKKLILTDLDNTLVPHDVLDPTDHHHAFVQSIHDAGKTLIIVSNNTNKRVSRFAKQLGIPYIANAKKPFRSSFKQLMKQYGVEKDEMILIGDQLLTDIYGANRFGMDSILVDPIADKDMFFTRFNRRVEKAIFDSLERHGKLKRGEYNDD